MYHDLLFRLFPLYILTSTFNYSFNHHNYIASFLIFILFSNSRDLHAKIIKQLYKTSELHKLVSICLYAFFGNLLCFVFKQIQFMTIKYGLHTLHTYGIIFASLTIHSPRLELPMLYNCKELLTTTTQKKNEEEPLSSTVEPSSHCWLASVYLHCIYILYAYRHIECCPILCIFHCVYSYYYIQ